jgi:serine/threonine-protein kinase
MQFIAGQIASTLDYVHQKSMTHGDLSVYQVYLGADDHVYIVNFGQAQVLFGTDLAKQVYAISAPETVAPERARGQGPSRQSDLYSLGILCYRDCRMSGNPARDVVSVF